MYGDMKGVELGTSSRIGIESLAEEVADGKEEIIGGDKIKSIEKITKNLKGYFVACMEKMFHWR